MGNAMAALDQLPRDITAGPANDGLPVTKSDSTDLSQVSRALYIGGTGDVTVIMRTGTQLTFSAVPSGALLPISVKRVMSTGTTATNIIAIW